MIRDDEIKRLIHYAKGLGVKIIIYNKSKPGTAAEWTTDGSLIQIYTKSNTSKTSVVLSLLHELGHHVWWIHEKDRQPDLKLEEALERHSDVNPIPKNFRKRIYDMENASTQWWWSIYKDADIKIPEWKIQAAMEFDVWMYEMYYENGKFPKGKQKRERYIEIQKKWRK